MSVHACVGVCILAGKQGQPQMGSGRHIGMFQPISQ